MNTLIPMKLKFPLQHSIHHGQRISSPIRRTSLQMLVVHKETNFISISLRKSYQVSQHKSKQTLEL